MRNLFLFFAITAVLSARPQWIGGGTGPEDWEQLDERPVHYPGPEDIQKSPTARMHNRRQSGPDYGVQFGSHPSERPSPARSVRPPREPEGTHRNADQQKRMIALFKRCKSLGPWLGSSKKKGEDARELYRSHCSDVISRVAQKEKLDVLYPLHGEFLMTSGRHQEANRFLTLNYQHRPADFKANLLLGRNLLALGQTDMARELFEFYEQNFPRKIGDKEKAAIKAAFQLAEKGTQVASQE